VELGRGCPFVTEVLHGLPDVFTSEELESQLKKSFREHRSERNELAQLVEQVIMLAKSNYEIQYTDKQLLSERLIFPLSPTESNGIEDARFVQFHSDSRATCYYATYSAFDGRMVLPQLLETSDFRASSRVRERIP
jgi:predicted GH43/DUF377 family glycosyl hydrolase